MPLRDFCRKVGIDGFYHFFLTIFQTTNLTPYFFTQKISTKPQNYMCAHALIAILARIPP